MEDSWKQDGECPYCRDPFEIAQVKFGFNCISFVSACPNCRLASISRTTERDPVAWPVVSVPAARYLVGAPGSVRRACAARAGAALPDNAVGLGASSTWRHRLQLAAGRARDRSPSR